MTIKNCGKLEVESYIKDGKGMRNTKEFLNNLAKEFVKENRNFFDYFGDLAYTYREKQLHSTMIPTIYKVSNNIFTEIPTYRKDSENLGWIDYGTYYGNTLMLIELKHSYYGLNSNKFRKSSINEWETSLNQIESIDDMAHLKYNKSDNVVKIALNVITVYTRGLDKELKNISDIKENIKNSIEENIEFIASWEVHNDMLVEFEYENATEIYPYVFFIGKVSTI